MSASSTPPTQATPPVADAAGLAAAIGEPARARMLYGLLDRRARTSTELAAVAGVSTSTASTHLQRLAKARLVDVDVQGRHRYYRLHGKDVARVLEGLSVIAGAPRQAFVPNTPIRLRYARTCYDHLAGSVGVELHDRVLQLGWLESSGKRGDASCALTPAGAAALSALGIDTATLGASRRKFAYHCLDWSERRPHLGGALAAALLGLAMRKRWLTQDLDSRAVTVTALGRRELLSTFGVRA